MAADQAPMHTLPNSTSTQSRGAEAKHKHKHGRCGSSSSGSAAEDDLGSGQQGGSSAHPGLDTVELFLPYMHVFPCSLVSAVKNSLLHTRLCLPRCTLRDLALVSHTFAKVGSECLSFAHTFTFSGVGSV